MKTYEIRDDSYWVSNGCDCCEPDHFECYNVNYEDFPITGCHSRSSLEDLWLDILVENGIMEEPDWEDEEFEIDWNEIKRLFDDHSFELEFV